MYQINGVDLDNSALGWKLKRTSATRPTIASRAASVVVPGRDGFAHIPTVREETTMTFVIDVPNETLDILLTLMTQIELHITSTERTGVRAIGRLLSATPEESHRALGWDRYAFLVEIPQGRWEDVTETTTPAISPTVGGIDQEVFEGITAPIQEGLVRFRGPLTQPQVRDLSGAYVIIDAPIASGTYVRFDMRTGRAWATTTDVWTGGTEVSGQVSLGGPRKFFEIQPRLVGVDKTRKGIVRISAASGTGTVQIRARKTYLTI